EIEDAEVTGSVRRRLEVVRNVNIAVATRKPEAVIVALRALVENAGQVGDDAVKGLLNGEMEGGVHLSAPRGFGANLLRTTGPAEFVEAFGKLPKARNEEDLFKRAGFAYVPPERRETADDLRLKRARKLVTLESLRGTFHVHTTFSDGRNTVLEMLTAARERGLQYVGISDHSPAAYYAGGVSEERLRQQWREIDKTLPEVAPLR